MMPTYQIPVTLIAWIEGMRIAPPSLAIQDIMTHHIPRPTNDSFLTETLAQVSDVLVFDFLLDGMGWDGMYVTWQVHVC
jgi:hypothetical protein